AFPTADIGRKTALALARALGDPEPAASLELLVRRALIDAITLTTLSASADRERLHLHPQLRILAARAFAAWPRADRDLVSRALAAHYAVSDNETPSAALALDEASIIAALEWAHDHGEDTLVTQLCSRLQRYWCDGDRDHTFEALQYLPWGIVAARR